MTSLWLFVTPCSTQLLCLLSSAAPRSLEHAHGVECVPWQSHVLFWSCPFAVLMSSITLAVSILHHLCFLFWYLFQSTDMFHHFYIQWGVCSLLIILTSYVFIVVTVIKMPSAGGLQKAFSTCASHLSTSTFSAGLSCSLLCTQLQKLMASGQSSHYVFYCHDSYAESPYQ